MKRIAWLLTAILVSGISLYGEDAGKTSDMTGWLCNSKCVTQSAGHAACDQSCADKSGDVVLVDDHGQVFKIANQDKVIGHAGKKVKMKCKPVKGSQDTMNVDSLYLGG
ncbi:MAG: hypothetical protein WB562_08405 [Candidatus Sulfotelmatobacter sp.]